MVRLFETSDKLEEHLNRGNLRPDQVASISVDQDGFFVLVYYLGGPLLIRFTQRMTAHPGFQEIDFNELNYEHASFLRSRTLKMLGIGESAVEEALAELVRSTTPTVATYAKSDGVHVRITDKAADAATADAHVAGMERTIRDRLGQYVWGTDDETLGAVIARGLERRGWRVATAESLSCGDVARTLADAPGARDWFAGGTVLMDAGAAVG